MKQGRQGTTRSRHERPEDVKNLSCAVRLEYTADSLQGPGSQEGQRETCKTMQQRWETQWQEFLKTLQPNQPGAGNPIPPETSPWEDPKAFLASFEQVAQACHWPRGEWAAQSGIKCPSHASSLLSLEGPEMSEAEQNEGSMSLQETGATLQTMEQGLIQPGQRTIFWQVLQEENSSTDCLGVKNRNWIKMETSLYGGNDPEEASRTTAQLNTGNVSTEDNMQKEGYNSLTFPATSNIHGLRWEFQVDKTSTKGKNEWCDISDDLTTAIEKNPTVQTEGGKALLPKQGRKCCYKSGFVEMQGKPCPCPSLEETIQQKRYLDKLQRTHSAEQEAEPLEVRKDFCLGDDLMGTQLAPQTRVHKP
ncbi:hypothetical protein E2320_014425 [Naja naja]|nr:hypothetical protein E2320_014425 [Naja naja]